MTRCFTEDYFDSVELGDFSLIGHNLDDFDEMRCYDRLQYLYFMINKRLIPYQHPITGLFPQYSGVESDNHIALIRDNVYCALCLWLASLSFQKIDDTQGRTYEMRQAAVKCMRHILLTLMTYSKNLNNFLTSHEPNDSLPNTIDIYEQPCPPHLELHSISLYLFVLCKMASRGVRVVYTKDEVDFVQHLVFYLERSYRIPDQGIWGNGNRYQNYKREIMSSTLGMVKAALEAASYCNLFGKKDISYMCYVDADALARNIEILHSSLPRESLTKDVDSSLLFIVGFPAFSINSQRMSCYITKEVEENLAGKYGFKRFRCDVFGSNSSAKQSNLCENDQIFDYDGVESQWPLFFALSAINAIFDDNRQKLEKFHNKLKDIIIYDKKDGFPILPQCYCNNISRENGINEKVDLLKNENLYHFPENKIHLWSQAILIIYLLFRGKLVYPNDYMPRLDSVAMDMDINNNANDSLNLSYYSIGFSYNNVIQMTLVTETKLMQHKLATYGVITQHISEIKPILLYSPDEMIKLFANLGVNEKLHLKGRPTRPLGVLTTSKIYRLHGKIIISYPIGLEITDFYFNKDIDMFIDRLLEKLEFLRTEWSFHGRPTVVIVIRPEFFTGRRFLPMIKFLRQLRSGLVGSVRIKLDRLQTLLQTAYIENFGFSFSSEKLENLSLSEKFFSSMRRDSERRFSHSSPKNVKKRLSKQDSIFVAFVGDEYEKAQRDFSLLSNEIDPSMDMSGSYGESECQSINLSSIKGENLSTDTRDIMLNDLVNYCQTYITTVDDFVNFYTASDGDSATQLLLLRYAAHIFGLDQYFSLEHHSRNKDIELGGINNSKVVNHGSATGWTIRDEIIHFYTRACINYDWNVVRYTTTLLSIFVDSLSPNVTYLLISGKPISIGIYGKTEFFYRSPPNPGVIINDIREVVGRDAPREASLHQEVITHLRSEISFNPKLFKRLYTLRIGHIIHAMRLVNQWQSEWKKISFSKKKSSTKYNSVIYALSPMRIKEILQCVLSFTDVTTLMKKYADITPYQIRVIQGLLGFIPKGFFVDFNFILSRCDMGVKIEGQEIPKYPNFHLMNQCDFSFGTRIIDKVDQVKLPELRQIYIETVSVVSDLLRRNPEVVFKGCFNLSSVVEKAQLLFNNDLAEAATITNPKLNISAFKSLEELPTKGPICSKSYIMKAFISKIIDDNDTMLYLDFC